jgi:hypothetical protein
MACGSFEHLHPLERLSKSHAAAHALSFSTFVALPGLFTLAAARHALHPACDLMMTVPSTTQAATSSATGAGTSPVSSTGVVCWLAKQYCQSW